MWIAVLNNLTDFVLGTAWTGLVLWVGYRIGAWREKRRHPRQEAAGS